MALGSVVGAALAANSGVTGERPFAAKAAPTRGEVFYP